MADKTQLEMLKGEVSAWNVWRAAHTELQPDLAEAHLHGLDLIGANLDSADLRKADLRGTNLSDASLVDAHLEGATFFRAILDRANLAGAHLVGARFLTSGHQNGSLYGLRSISCVQALRCWRWRCQ